MLVEHDVFELEENVEQTEYAQNLRHKVTAELDKLLPEGGADRITAEQAEDIISRASKGISESTLLRTLDEKLERFAGEADTLFAYKNPRWYADGLARGALVAIGAAVTAKGLSYVGGKLSGSSDDVESDDNSDTDATNPFADTSETPGSTTRRRPGLKSARSEQTLQ